MLLYLFSLLASTSYRTPESAPPGEGRGGAIGGGGEPLCYEFIARGHIGFSSWNISSEEYSIGMINKGNNPLTKVEVVSMLNIANQTAEMLFYNQENCPEKYAPKVYFSTLQTIATNWIYNDEDSWKNTQKMDWPQAFQTSQKGEANYLFRLYCYENKSWN